ncbi:peroxisome assembly protein 12 [Bacillus rossius redtenbacheri]|uniref:peroxisome assembly protein 12 n=1 Tax=Bacillus rossius redtenbacheri TaxID=93214 RepID=UPI002FDE243C
MAERGANVTSSLQIKPSIFELVAQESLTDALYPAYKRICTWLATNFPEKLGWLARWFDELYLAYNAGVELDSLLSNAASYSEHFYSLRRVSTRGDRAGRLSAAQLCWSLASLCALPYARGKLGATAGRRWGLAASTLLLEGASLVWLLAYLRGRAAAHSPLLSAAGLALRYSAPAPETPPVRGATSWTAAPLLLLSVLRAYRRCETAGLFLLQFLHAWESDPGRPRLGRLPVPPPPPRPSGEGGRSIAGKCPVCLLRPSVPTVLPVSGYVFCFRCITEHLSATSRCPVTKHPALATDLIRLHDLNS